MEKIERFWMVWVAGERGPGLAHETLDGAKIEAERLVILNTNGSKKVYVLQAVQRVEREEIKPPVTWTIL